MAALGNCIGRKRGAAGLRQEDLASRSGISRQSLSALESGRRTPSAALALRLARELGCTVEDLFWIDGQQAPVSVELASEALDDGASAGAHRGARSRAARVVPGTRVVLGWIDGRWVAHRLVPDDAGTFQTAADGALSGGGADGRRPPRVTPFTDVRAARDTLFCAGCAPAFGILAARATAAGRSTEGKTDRIVWLERSSGVALELLARGQVQVAGAHLFDEEADEFNVPFVQRRLPGRSMLIFNLTRWQTGLVVARGNPRRIRGVRDLARPDVTFVARPRGAAAQELIDRLRRREGIPAAATTRPPIIARGHMDVARIVALGLADTGVALPEVARAHGLDFIPLAEERFDLILAKTHARDARVVRLLETLSGRSFRREMETLGGHIARAAGQLIADTTPSPPRPNETRS